MRLGISLSNNPVDIGVRVEVPAVVTDAITDELYEPKLALHIPVFRGPGAHLLRESSQARCARRVGATWSLSTAIATLTHERKTEKTNFALLVSTRFTEPFKEPIEYGKSIARLANMLGKDILVQRLGGPAGGAAHHA